MSYACARGTFEHSPSSNFTDLNPPPPPSPECVSHNPPRVNCRTSHIIAPIPLSFLITSNHLLHPGVTSLDPVCARHSLALASLAARDPQAAGAFVSEVGPLLHGITELSCYSDVVILLMLP